MVITNLVAVALCFVILLLCIVILLGLLYLARIVRFYSDDVIKHHGEINAAISKYLSSLNNKKD